MEEVTAKIKGARTSPQKARLVADSIRGRPVGEALDILNFSPRKAADILRKLLQSALANAEHNEKWDVDELHVSAVLVNEGPMMKRLKPRARGRADRIHKRTSHITLKLGRAA